MSRDVHKALPALVLIGLLILYPVAYAIWLSFFDKHSFFPAERWVGLGNYARLIRDPEFWDSLWKGTVYAAGTTALQLVFGLASALLLHRAFRGRTAVRALVLFPYMIPTIVAVIVWRWLLNETFGLVDYVLVAWGLARQPIAWLGVDHIMTSLIAMSVWQFAPFVTLSVLARLVRRLGNADLVPMHRIDRDTAGLVLFSADPATRAAYQDLFRLRRIDKRYEALAPALPALERESVLVRRSRLLPGEPFFRMCETAGAPNSESRIEVVERAGALWRYALEPVSGRKHQLRVHMAALGAPILHDRLYPELADAAVDDHARPLQLLARSLQFIDPLSGAERWFETEMTLGGNS